MAHHPCFQKSASLPPPADHAECGCSGPGARRCRTQLGRLRHAPTETRLQPGDLYPSADGVQSCRQMLSADVCVCVCKSLSVELKHLHGCVSLDVESVCPPDLLLSDKRLFETKRKDQLNALKNLVELNDINQQYKIIDIMLKGLFKVQCVCVCVCKTSYSAWEAASQAQTRPLASESRRSEARPAWCFQQIEG